jgi:hypothetical protein
MSRLSGPVVEQAWNIGDLAINAEASVDVTVSGAKLGDFVLASMDIDLEQGTLLAQVRAANTVEVTYINTSADPTDLPAATLRVKVVAFEDI